MASHIITQEVLDRDKQIKKELKQGKVVHKGCYAEWHEWSGSKRYPKKTEHSAENCTVVVKDTMCDIILKSGEVITRKKSSTGFLFKTKEELVLEKQREKERLAEMRKQNAEMNDKLKSMLQNRTTKIFVADYFDCAERERGSEQNINITKLDVELTQMTRKDFAADLKESGLNFAKRTIDECDRNNFSRLGIKKLVVIAESKEAATDLLNQNAVKYIKRCAEEFDNGIDEYCEYYGVSKERYNELSGNEQPKPEQQQPTRNRFRM